MKQDLKSLLFRDIKAVPHEYIWAAFFLPILLLGGAFFSLRVHPLGPNSIAICDLFHQFAPLLAEFRRKVLSGDSLLFSWNMGLGDSFVPTIAYYCSSPLNVIVLFFPEKNLLDAIAILVLLRTGLSGLFFSFLIYKKDKREGPVVLALSVIYALSGFVLSYFWTIIWMDAVVLLPLVVLGIWQLIAKKNASFYILMLFLTVFSNFYMGFFVCVFSAAFFLLLFMEAHQRKEAQPFLISFLRFSGSSLLAVLMSSVLLLPTIFALKQTASAGEQMTPTIENAFSFFDFLSRFLLHTDPVVREGLPNVFCGVLVFLVIPLYLFCAGIPFWRRLSTGLFAGFLFLSMANPYLNFIWHGLHFTNQLPYRYSFLLIFVLIYMASDLFLNFESISRKSLAAAMFLLLFYLVLLNRGSDATPEPLLVYGSAALILIYGTTLHFLKGEKKSRGRAEKALLYIVILEMFFSCEFALSYLADTEHFVFYDAYAQHAAEISRDIKARDGESFARTVVLPQESINDGALLDLKTVSVFLSTTPRSTFTLLGSLGFANNGFNHVWSEGLTEVSASLLGVKNVVTYTDGISINEIIQAPASAAESSSSNDIFTPDADQLYGGYAVSTNENVLPVGYGVPLSGLSYTPDLTASPFDNTNSLLRAMGCPDVYYSLDRLEINRTNLEIGEAEDIYRFLSPDNMATYTFKPTQYVPGRHLYLYVGTDEKTVVLINFVDQQTGERSQILKRAIPRQILDCGILPEAATDFTVRISIEKNSSQPIRISAATTDTEALHYAVNSLGVSGLTDITYTSDTLSGSFTIPADYAMLFTIPYDEGWTAMVDGQSIRPIKAYGSLLAVPIAPGEHTITLSYRPQGLTAGIVLSLVSFVVFFAICFHKYIMNFIRARYPAKTTAYREERNTSV